MADWVSKLKGYNERHGVDIDNAKGPIQEGGDSKEDKRLLEEYYVKFKGEASKKYALIPKFYSKVS